MNWIGWLVLLLLIAAAGTSVWFAFHSPKFIAGLTKFASRQAWKAIKPVIVTPMTPEETEAKNKAVAQGRGDEYTRRRQGSLRPDR